MKKIVAIIAVVFGLAGFVSSQNIPLPSQAQLMWHNGERIMFVHWGMATWQNREYDNHTTNLDDVHPSKYNTDQWCEVARSWGATMIIFVAKHTGGFCWWQTNTSDYGVKQLKWKDGKADVMEDLSKSCKKYGLRLGVYIYPGDDRWGAGIGSGGICEDASKQKAYNKIFRQQLKEVLTNYGKISEVWFDGNCKIPVKDILEEYAKDAVIFQGEQASLRWVGNEDGIAPYPNWYSLDEKDLKKGNATALNSDVNGDAYAPVEIDVPLLKNKGHKWFWSVDSDSLLLSVEQLMNLYYKSVGRGSVLLLNSTPDTSGLIPQSHCQIYKAFGDEIIRRFSFPLKMTKGTANTMQFLFKEPTLCNHITIEEDLAFGQRILEYVVKGKQDGKWITLCKGTSVGSKRIEYFKDVVLDAIKLEITKFKDTPVIKHFMVFNVQTSLTDLILENEDWRPVQVSYWDKNSFNERDFNDFTIDLTDYANNVGEYVLSFNQLSMDYAANKSSRLIFEDIQLEIYGKKHNDLVKQIAPNQFLITNSQQTLKEYPIIFKAKIKHSGANSVGEINLRKINY